MNDARLHLPDIGRSVAARCGLTKDELTGPCRKRKIARARFLAMALARELTPLSLPAIGRYFGGRDHSTVHHALVVAKRLVAADPKFAADMAMLRCTLRPGDAP